MSTLVTTNLKHGGAASPNIVLTSGGDVTFGGDVTLGTSVLAAPTGSAPSYTCRAWVNFDGTGTFSPNPSTSKIRASGNVTSITDNGTGNYTVNFTTAMPDVNYAVGGAVGGAGASGYMRIAENTSTAMQTTSVNVNVITSVSSSNIDLPYVTAVVFR